MKRPRLPGVIERYPKTSIIATGLVLALGGLEIAGYVENPTEPMPAGACESPFAATGSFVDPNGSTWKTDSGVGEGIVITAKLPKGAEGVVAGFESPGAGNNGWQQSEMVPATGSIVLKFAIGQGDVDFGVSTVSASHDPAACAAPEITNVTWRSAGDYFDAPGQLPWPNPVDAAINALP